MRRICLWIGLVAALVGPCVACAAKDDFELTASDGRFSNHVLVEWDEVEGPVPVGFYVVYRAEEGGRFRETATRGRDQTSYRDYRANPCVTYRYYVAVVWDYSPRPESNVDEGYTSILPAIPQGIAWSELPLHGGVEMSWNTASGAEYYELRRHQTQTESAVLSWTTSRESFEFTDIGPCTPRYWVDVRSCSACGCSAWSDLQQQPSIPAVGGPPSGHVTASASVGALDQITLAWNALPGADSYEVYRADEQTGSYILVDRIEAEHYEDAFVQGCRDYWYGVRGCNGDCGCGPFSEPVVGSCLASIPAKPANLTSAKAPDECAFAFTWDPVPGATHYEITYSQYPFAVSTQEHAIVEDPMYVHAGPAMCGPVCDYAVSVYVAACNCSGCGGESYSTAVWRTTNIGEIVAPANLTAVQSNSLGDTSPFDVGPSIVLTWDPVANVTYYQVYVEAFDGQTDPDLSQSRQSVVDPVCSEANQSLGLAKYWVRGCCCCTCGPFSFVIAQKSAPGEPVENLQATEGTMPHGIRVSWDSFFGVTGPLIRKGYYQVERTHGDEASEVMWTGQSTGFFDGNVIACEPYSYVVHACNESGCGPGSEPVVGWTGKPEAPAVTLLPEGGDSPASLKWISMPGAEYYEVRRASVAQLAQQPGSSGYVVAVIMGPHPPNAALTYPIEEDSSLSGYYYYTVVACNACGCSASEGLIAVYH